MRLDLIVIDGQNDFLDPKGALYVKDADQEAMKLVECIEKCSNPNNPKISKIHPTMDSHHKFDIAHGVSWRNRNGEHPAPFTIITEADVKAGTWESALVGRMPFHGEDMSYQSAFAKYVSLLASRGRNPLCIWPEHCKIGTWGQNVYPALSDAYDLAVTNGKNKWINFVTKGDWPFTEHYSAIEADVPDPKVPKTQLNTSLLNDVNDADLVVWAGWAGSHCLRWTGLDAVNYFPENPPGSKSNDFLRKSIFLVDCSGPVVDPTNPTLSQMFADWRNDFFAEVEKRGARVMTTDEFTKFLGV